MTTKSSSSAHGIVLSLAMGLSLVAGAGFFVAGVLFSDLLVALCGLICLLITAVTFTGCAIIAALRGIHQTEMALMAAVAELDARREALALEVAEAEEAARTSGVEQSASAPGSEPVAPAESVA